MDEAIRNVEFAFIALPQVVMGKFVTDDGFQFVGVEQREHWTGENDVALSGDKKERSVQLRAILRLIERDGNIELEPAPGLIQTLKQLRVAIRVQAIGGFEKFQAQVFGVVGFGLSGSE